MAPHQNRLSETVLMRGQNVCFYEEIWKIIPKFPCYAFLSGALNYIHVKTLLLTTNPFLCHMILCHMISII